MNWMGLAGAPATWRSSEYSSRAFCQTCGSSLGAIDDAPTVALLLGAFDWANRRDLAPQYDSCRSGRPRWWCIEIRD